MNLTKILIAGIAGAVVAFILGFISWGIVFDSFFDNNLGSAVGVSIEDDMLWVPMILGHLSWGMLFALIYGRWARISTFATGAKAGAVIGFLAACTFDLIQYGSTNVYNLAATVVDILIMTVIATVTGGLIGMLMQKED
jgi:uncharacterized membrane protein